ncbi:MAG: hypothetical protein J5954_03710 [Prevotella sp.]|nr:hypothetical protein [Prevotella sp.]
MKIKCFMTMMAAVAVVLGMSSCGSDDDNGAEVPVAVATQVEGSYSGNEVIKVMGDESSNETKTYEFVKASDTALDLTVPASGEGMMMIPALPVKNIPLTKSGDIITGKLETYESKVTTAQGAEKNYTISNLVVIFNDKTVAVTFSLKYGNMPMSMETTFAGEKK